MRRLIGLATFALYLASAGAALAAKYAGTLNGEVTSGGSTYSTASDLKLFTSYVGKAVTVKFVADTGDDVYDTVLTVGANDAVIGFGYPNGLDSDPSAAFTGDAIIGALVFSGHTGSFYNSGTATFFFADATSTQGPLKGGGSVDLNFNDEPQGGPRTVYAFSFKFDNGFVIGPDTGEVVTSPVPEPAVWMLMVVGFGLVGLEMRRSVRVAAVALGRSASWSSPAHTFSNYRLSGFLKLVEFR